MRHVLIAIIGLEALIGLCAVSPARAASLTMDRVTDADMAWYRAFTCTGGATCTPATREPLLDIAQPLTGNPSKVIPATLAGRIAYKSEDLVGNQSGLSNTIPFRGAVLSAPAGLQQIP